MRHRLMPWRRRCSSKRRSAVRIPCSSSPSLSTRTSKRCTRSSEADSCHGIRAGGHADLEYCRRAHPPGLGRMVRGSPTRPKCTFSGFKHCRRRAITVCVAPATQKSPTESRVASHASLDFVFVLTKDRIPNTCKRPRCYWKSSPDEDTSYPRQGKHLSADHCPRAHPRLTFEVVL